jgi:hypothetical protein
MLTTLLFCGHKKMAEGGGVPLKELQRRVIKANLELAPSDRIKVVHRLHEAARKSQTRVVMLAVVKFEDGDVQIVPDMADFVASFDHVHFDDATRRQITTDDFSIAMLGTAGEEAYKQSMRLVDFLTATHEGWYMTVQEAVAAYRKPRNLWKRFAHAFESYDKKFSDYRVIVDLHKTDEIRKGPLLAHERGLLFGPVPAPRTRRLSNDTLNDASSGVFSREDATPRIVAPPKVVAESVSERSFVANSTKEEDEDDDISGSSGDTPLDTSAKEFIAEVNEVKRARSSASLSSSTSSVIIVSKKSKGSVPPPKPKK